MERDLSWRLDELRHLRNRLLNADQSQIQIGFRTLIVLQYAHVEGFAKQSLSLYSSAINGEKMLATRAAREVAASTLVAELSKWRTGDPTQLGLQGEDRRYRRAQADTQFLESVVAAMEQEVDLDVDSVVDLESNLSKDILKRVLYRVGIDPDRLDDSFYSSLEWVRLRRNKVAHGNSIAPIDPAEFEAHRTKTVELMNETMRLIYHASRMGLFRREPVMG